MAALRSPALAIYLLASRLAGPVAGQILKRRLARGKEHPERLGERQGRAGRPHPGGRLIWMHGASVGEAMSMLPLIDALRAKSNASILVTTGTVTSAQRLDGLLPDAAFHQFVPVDTGAAVRRFLDHWRPDMAIWVESEIWPRLIYETVQRGIPAALINARLSQASIRRWHKVPAMARNLFGAFRTVLTQDMETLERLNLLGVSARFAGNLKALVPDAPVDQQELERLRSALGAKHAWLAASTHSGEEEIVIDAQKHLLESARPPLLILAPRHPERGDDIAGLLAKSGLVTARRSRQELPDSETQVFLADTMGEMGLWYRLAPATFVGGSLVDKGGHTPFEPVRLHSAVLHGPHTANFAPAYAALSAEEAALEVRDAEAMANAVHHLLEDVPARREMASRALNVNDLLKPNVESMAEELLALMETGR